MMISVLAFILVFVFIALMSNSMAPEGQKTGPKDIFMQLLSMAALYFSAISLGSLVFQYINLAFPDILRTEFYARDSYLQAIRWAVAVLVVVFPVYVWTIWYLEKNMKQFPEKRDLRTRKWLIYFTVFAAAGVIIGDFVALIFNYLQGDLTTRFFLKIGTVLVIAGAVFGFYFFELRRQGDLPKKLAAKILSWVAIGVVVVAVGGGFYMAGSPQAARKVKLDEQRLGDLQSMQGQIVYFWQQKNRLPANATELTDSLSGYKAPTDPETGQAYTYEVLGDLKFKLCANFTTEVSATPDKAISGVLPPGAYPDYFNNWQHGVGLTCFERTIDKQLYEIKK